MTTMSKRKYKSIALVMICLATVVSALWVSIAVFTDRVNQTSTIQVSGFDDSGYSIERAVPEDYLVAGETAEVLFTESNPKESDLDSQISITSIWNSPVSENYPWGNSTSDNVEITYEVNGQTYEVNYTVNKDQSISFALPKHTIKKDGTLESALKFKLPDQLVATGDLTFTFDDITLSNGGWSNGYGNDELTKLHFGFETAWNISKAQTDANGNHNKDVLAAMFKPDGAADDAFGLHVVKNGLNLNTNQGKMMDWTAAGTTPWADYSITNLKFDENLTSIGDFAFTGEGKITEVVLPNTLEMIGTSAFDNSGLVGTVTIPASVNMIEALAFGNLPNVTVFTFEHSGSDIIDLPDNQTASLSKNGAFYVESYVKTEVNTSNDSILVDYSWVNDNRAKMGIEELVLSYKDVPVGETQDPTLTILPDNYDAYQKIEYKILSGSTYISIEPNSGSVTGLKEGTASVQVTIIDANGNSISQTAPVKVYQLVPMLAPQNTWFTKGGTTISQTAIKSINFMDSYSPTTYVKKWDASDSSVPGTVTAYLEKVSGSNTYKLTLTGNGSGKIRANKNSAYAFSNADSSKRFTSLTEITGLDIFDTSAVTNMGYMFNDCSKLTTLDVSNFDTSSVLDMNHMFYCCSNLTTLDVNNFDTSAVTDMSSMFYDCSNLTTLDVSNFDTGKVTNMRFMFSGCEGVTQLDVSDFDTNNVTNFSCMFQNCSNLTSLNVSNFDTTSATDMNHMFFDCSSLTSLDVSNFNTGRVTNMSYMFQYCSGLKTLELNNFDTSAVTNMSFMFRFCSDLTTLNISSFDTGSVTDMSGMFQYCSSLTTLNLSHFNTNAVTDMSYMFDCCSELKTLDVSNFDTTSITSTYELASFAASCGNLTEIKLSAKFGQKTNIPAPGETYGMFYAEGSTSHPLRTKVTDANSAILAYDWTTDHRGYTITVANTDGGALQVNPSVAINGKTITVTANTDSGITYGGATISYTDENGANQSINLAEKATTFVMPAGDITITPKWERPTPMLASGSTWYTKGGTTVSQTEITSINLLDTYSPTTYIEKWDASDSSVPGTVTAYLEDDGSGNNTYKLTLAGNGSGKIQANKNSAYAFSNSSLNKRFMAVTDITGISILDTSSVTNMSYMFARCRSLTELDVSNFDTGSVTNMSGMFENCLVLTTLDVSNFDTGAVTDMGLMFAGCNSLKTLDVSNFETGAVTRMASMFSGCGGLTTLDVSNFDTSAVTSMSYMFSNCSSLTTLDVRKFDTSSVTSMSNMFFYCKNLTALDVSNFDTGAVTSMSSMFRTCSNLTTLDVSNFDTSAVTDMAAMFASCYDLTTLDLGNFDTSSVTEMHIMFDDCFGLKTLDVSNFDTSSVTRMDNMFSSCSQLTTLDVSNFDTSSVTNMRQMFAYCSRLASLDISNFDTSSITTTNGLTSFAASCGELTEIKFGENFGQEINIPESGEESGMFYVEESSNNPLRTKVTGANDLILAYDWAMDHRGYLIDVSAIEGGSLTADPTVCINGKSVFLSPTPNTGNVFGGATLSYTDETGSTKTTTLTSNVSTFTMPASDVTITPIWNTKPLSGPDLEPGDIVKLPEDGNSEEYIVVQIGNPDPDIYDDSCDGIWLLRKNILTVGRHNNGFSKDFQGSIVQKYLNSTFLSSLAPSVQNAVKTATLPVTEQGDWESSIFYARSSVTQKVFLLSLEEMYANYKANYHVYEGTTLDYFLKYNDHFDDGYDAFTTNLIAYYNGVATPYWTRTLYDRYYDASEYEGDVWMIWQNGEPGNKIGYFDYGYRPALILPLNAQFDSSSGEFVGLDDEVK